jgi:hypothetical protein
MSGRVVLILGLALISVGASAPTSQTSSQTSPRSSSSSSSRRSGGSGYSDRYGLLEERNIFVRDRATSRRSSRGDSGSTTRPAPRPPEEKLVLTGVVLEEDGYRAYVENDRSEVLRLAAGDKVARGRVAAIMIDAIAYDPTPAGNTPGNTTTPATNPSTTAVASTPAQRVWVEIGCDLTGKPSSMLAESYTSSGSATTAPTTGPAIASEVANLNPNDPNLTAEQKMKLRRAMELQKK